MEKEKLEYINNFIKFASNKRGKEHHLQNLNLNVDWVNLTDDVIKIVNNEVKNILTTSSKNNQTPLNKMRLEIKNKKLTTFQFYLNLIIFTIALGYVDILIKVKYGGFIFTSFTFLSFYYGNKYFNKFKCSEMLKELAYKEGASEYLHALKLNQRSVTKEQKLTEIRLNKYWKEPMAWH